MKRIEDIICNFVVEKKIVDINEIIELYNIQQFFIIEFILYIGQNSS